MKILAEGCEHCNLKLRRASERFRPDHYGALLEDDSIHFGVRGDGETIEGVLECRTESGRAIQVVQPPRMCPCRPHYVHDTNGLGAAIEMPHPGILVQLVEYGSLEVFSVTQKVETA